LGAKKKVQQSTLAATVTTTAAESEVEEPPGSRRLIRASAARGSREGRTGAPRTVALLEASTDLTTQLQIPHTPPKAEPRTVREVRPRASRRLDLKNVEVVVLFSQALKMERGRPEDVVADEETEQVALRVVEALQGRVAGVTAVGVWDDLRASLKGVPAGAVIFNLVESLGGQAYTEFLPPRRFQRLGLRYTGVPSEALRLTGHKMLAKKIFEANGLATPRYQIVRRLGQKRFDVPLPAIVKPATEGGSLGITHEAIVSDPEALAARVDFILTTYRQPALIEEFIVGRELNVAVWGNHRPEVLPISEIDFRWTDDPMRKIVSFASKWEKDSIEYRETPGICPAPLKPAERKRVETAALKAYTLLGLEGYARVDIRLRDGMPYLLEVNGNPDLAPDAGFYRSARAAGHTYETMIAHILELGLERPAAHPKQVPLPLVQGLAAAAA
jgi:D-alanine-D-alanine ligase